MNLKTMLKNSLLTAAVGASVASACAQSAPAETLSGKALLGLFATNAVERATVLASMAASFRESAVSNAAGAVEYYFSPAAKDRWQTRVASEIEPPCLADFFRGTIELTGPQGTGGGVVGLYNPWWDALLLLRYTPADDGAKASPIPVSDWRLVSGETFRGEKAHDNPRDISVTTVVPKDEPLSVALWRVCSGTRKAFGELFPSDGPVSWGKASSMLLKLDAKREMERIQARSAMRLHCMKRHLEDRQSLKVGAYAGQVLRLADAAHLKWHFQDGRTAAMVETFGKLPADLRKGLTQYCYVPDKNGALYLFINEKAPRFYATVSADATPTAKTTSLEWYDLAQCDELLNAWNGGKAVKK